MLFLFFFLSDKMESLPKPILAKILSHLDYFQILNYCVVDLNVCQSDDFWRYLISHRYPDGVEDPLYATDPQTLFIKLDLIPGWYLVYTDDGNSVYITEDVESLIPSHVIFNNKKVQRDFDLSLMILNEIKIPHKIIYVSQDGSIREFKVNRNLMIERLIKKESINRIHSRANSDRVEKKLGNIRFDDIEGNSYDFYTYEEIDPVFYEICSGILDRSTVDARFYNADIFGQDRVDVVRIDLLSGYGGKREPDTMTLAEFLEV